jgi:hypothetical protein
MKAHVSWTLVVLCCTEILSNRHARAAWCQANSRPSVVHSLCILRIFFRNGAFWQIRFSFVRLLWIWFMLLSVCPVLAELVRLIIHGSKSECPHTVPANWIPSAASSMRYRRWSLPGEPSEIVNRRPFWVVKPPKGINWPSVTKWHPLVLLSLGLSSSVFCFC